MSGIKGRSGGKREGAGMKSKLTDPALLADWQTQLRRAISQAAANGMVLRKDTFFNQRDIKAAFGKTAQAEFKTWFEASKHLNQDKADKLYHELATGKIDQAKFNKLFYAGAMFWVWSVKPEKQRQAWAISRGLK